VPAPAAVPAAPTDQTVVNASAGSAVASIRLKFQGESWVEVKQKDGRTVFAQLNGGNTEQTVSGTAPFTLTIGNASSVRLEYKGKAIDLKPYSRDDVAHVTLD
jgi:cytoskeleton protein RodZ